MNTIFIQHSDYLEHHGIKGQKWGLRRYQNSDGTLTEAGRKRYSNEIEKAEDRYLKRISKSRPRSTNVTRFKASVINKEVTKTKEFKNYRTASDELDKYGIDHKSDFNQKEYARLKNKHDKALDAYNKVWMNALKNHESELLSMKLKDLELPDDNNWRQVYKEHRTNKITRLYGSKYAENDNYLAWM